MRSLGRNSAQRRALLRNMTTSVLKHGKIETTEAKAKEVRRIVDKMITLGKQGDLNAYRQALAYLTDETVAKKLFDEKNSSITVFMQARVLQIPLSVYSEPQDP